MRTSTITLSLAALGASMTLAGPSHRSLHRRHHARARALAQPAGQPRDAPARIARMAKLEEQREIRRVARSANATTAHDDEEDCNDDGDDEDDNEPAGTGNSTTITIGPITPVSSNSTANATLSCTTEGDWMCQGDTLLRCDHSAWVTIAECNDDGLVCSVEPDTVGCIWSYDLQNSTSTNTTTGSGSPTDDGDDEGDDDCDEDDEPTSSAFLAAASSAAVGAPTSASASASATITPGPSQSVIGGNLFAPASSSASDDDWNDDSGSSSSSSKGKGRHHKSSSTDDWSASSSTEDWSASSSTDDWSPSSTADWSSPSQSSSNDDSDDGATPSSSQHHGKGHASSTGSASAALPTKSGKHGSGSSGGGGSTSQFSAPHYVIYADEWLNTMPSASDIGNYNRFILAFWMSDQGAVDDAQAWQQFDSDYRQQVLDEYHAAGIALMVSAFGSTDSPTSNGVDPASCATDLANWVKQYGLDGVDIDYEDMPAMNSNQAEAWLITFQQTLRQQLGSGYLISHAPVAPWFTSSNAYASGAYVKIHQEVGDSIDFYNVQFYNQGDIYVDCDSLINNSGGDWPDTSVMQINSYAGVPLNKIVIGKPNDSGAADNGYMDPSDLATCVGQAQSQGWNGGVMFWEWAGNHQSLIANVVSLL